jgi:sensor histidine kinase YesM
MNGIVEKSQVALKSTKEDASLHGIGTQNAFAIIRKYNGEYEVETKEDVFVIKMVFSL